MIIINNDERERERESEGSVVCEGFYFLYRMNIKTPPLIILLKPSKVRMIMMDEASKRMMNEWMLFLPQGGVRRRPKKVPLSFSALARGALQAPGCAEDRHSPPAGPPEGRRRQWCARRNDANKFLLFDVGSRNHFTKKSNLSKFYEKRRILPGILRPPQ